MTSPRRLIQVGDRVRVRLGDHEVIGTVVEDRGPTGVGGRRLVRVKVGRAADGRAVEVPADELQLLPRRDTVPDPEGSILRRTPARWRQDELSEFIEFSWGNVLATFANLPRAYSRLEEIDSYFTVATGALKDPPDLVSATLLLRTHSTYRASVRLAMSGQIPEAYPLVRATVELPLYAAFMHGDTDLQALWLRRGENDKARRLVRRRFALEAMLKHLDAVIPTLHGAIREIYQSAIDRGAHPNEQAILQNLRGLEGPDSYLLNTNYLTGDSPQLRQCLVSVVEAGLAALKVYRHLLPEHFDASGLGTTLDRFSVRHTARAPGSEA